MLDGMELEERVSELERRLAALEGSGPEHDGTAAPDGDEFWALEGLKAFMAEGGEGNGGVLFTGAVRLPTGEGYEWQYGRITDDLLASEWADTAEVFAALGNRVRMRLLREILGGRRTASDLTALDGIGTSGQIYHHLRQLTAAGWLRAAGRGRYEVPPTRVVPLLVALAVALP